MRRQNDIPSLAKSLFIVLLIFTTLYYTIKMTLPPKVRVQFEDEPVNVISARFLSYGVDTVMLANGVDKVGFDSQLLRNLTSLLAPAYIRLGGTLADRLTFDDDSDRASVSEIDYNYLHECSRDAPLCEKKILPHVSINKEDWIKINKFCLSVGAKLLFDLNALLRDGSKWNSTNARALIEFTKESLFDHNVDWQLGNEPNSFPHVFNVTIPPEQLSEDFMELKSIVDSVTPNSWVVGPDTTRPQPKRPECVKYMKKFLLGFGGKVSSYLNAITWHQYYLNGRLATLDDFWNSTTFDLLQSQIETMKENIDGVREGVQMWLSETSSAYGGGAPGLSNSYAGTPLWIDKLGMSALNGINVVIRQSLIGGNYSLLDKNFKPHPDWWISLLFKRLVGNEVLKLNVSSKMQRLYGHCSAHKVRRNSLGSVTIFGSNLSNETVTISFLGKLFQNKLHLTIDEYVILPKDGNRMSREITLNGKPLEYNGEVPKLFPSTCTSRSTVQMPGNAVAFWVIHGLYFPLCYKTSDL